MVCPFSPSGLSVGIGTGFDLVGSVVADGGGDAYAEEAVSLFVFESFGGGQVRHAQ